MDVLFPPDADEVVGDLVFRSPLARFFAPIVDVIFLRLGWQIFLFLRASQR